MAKPGKKGGPIYGRLFGRPDIERCDLFADGGYLSWGEYVGKPVVLNESSKKGRQILSSIPDGGHKKCAMQKASGYFETEFKTIAVNEPYVEKWRMTQRPPGRIRNGAWMPPAPAKQHSTPGDHYGTFTKHSEMKAFSPVTRPAPKGKEKLINFLTNPGKKGNSGYVNICINKYPPHTVGGKVDPYMAPEILYKKTWKAHKEKIRNGPLRSSFFPRPYFDPNPYADITTGPPYVMPKDEAKKTENIFYPPAAPKSPGNNHDGCFNKFTEWMPEPYVTEYEAQKMLSRAPKSNKVFWPEPRMKTFYTVSVVNNKIDTACNEKTWRTMKPITYPQFNL